MIPRSPGESQPVARLPEADRRMLGDERVQRIVDQQGVGVHLLQPRILGLQLFQAFEGAGGEAAVFCLPVVPGDFRGSLQ
jgi:hypothetical protein